MSKNSLKLNKPKFMFILVLFCILFVIINTLYAAGQPRQRQSRRSRGARGGDARGTDRQDDRMQEKLEERGEAVENAAEAIDTNLIEMLNLVNELQQPGVGQMGSARRSLENSRKYLKEFSDNVTCQYYMLNAWLNYYDSGAEKAVMPATQAYRKDSSNNDAHATQAAIAILAGQKPLTIRPERQQQAGEPTSGRQRRSGSSSGQSQQTSRRSSRRGTSTTTRGGRTPGSAGQSGTGTASSGNILNLNADSIKADWLGQKIGPLQFDCLNGTKFSYDPADAKLCMLFWNLNPQNSQENSDSEKSDNIGRISPPPAGGRFATSRSRTDRMSRRGRASISDRTPYQPGRGAFSNPTASGDSLSSQMSGFANLFNSEFQNPELKFVAINTDPPQSKPEVMAKLLENPWPWAQAMLNTRAAEQLADTNVAKLASAEPTLVICGENGTAKYAGPAAGFLAPMVLRELTGAHTPLDAQYIIPTQTDPNAQQIQQPQLQPQQNIDITSEDFQAQKLLEYARGLFIPAGRKGFLSSRTAVDLCRQVISEYPDTQYSEEARKLLRSLPPDEQKKYNITNEEMGL
jgi:hypothetical protein